MSIAAFWGTTVGYSKYHNNTIVIEKTDGSVAVIKEETFNYLYLRLDDFNAALKEDCIEYVVIEADRGVLDYPEWYFEACSDGVIYQNSDICVFHDHKKEKQIQMYPGSIVMRNYKEELKHIESYKFHQYYETIRE